MPPEPTHGDAPHSLHSLSPEGQARLLEMTYQRLYTSILLVPLIALALSLFYQLRVHDTRMWWWLALQLVLVPWAVALRPRFRRDREQLGGAQVMERWRPRLERLALAHGLATTAPWALAAMGPPHYEFAVALLVTSAVTLASNATHQTPVLSVFNRFFMAGWNTSLLFQPWLFPELWPYSLPLSLCHTYTMVRHSRQTHRFSVQQVWLEERSQHLLAQYREARDTAEAALAEKNRFLSTAAHDLRQPVHAMGLLTEAIALRNQDPALAPPLSDLQRNMHSVHLMFNSLLDLSKIESSDVAVQPEILALEPLLHEMQLQFAPEAQARGLALRVRSPQRGAAVHADATLLRQCLSNLVHNALRYTQRGGVLVGVRLRGDHWRVEVWDTGMGVALEEQKDIYRPFYRPQHAWHINRTGHGLGLALVARCATLMGARHGLQSRLGRGSCFWLELPVAPLDHPPMALSLNPQSVQLHGRCLVLDDDPQVQRAWSALLASWGVQVRMACDAAQAFAHLDGGFTPQAILCDQRLRSGESGFDILRALLDRCPEACGAMVSGEFDSPDLREAEADGYLVLRKPVDVSVLHALLTQWLGGEASPPDPAPSTSTSPSTSIPVTTP
jgi:signal transduction histidine kinase/CheY-like chemotaxis protein